jgi:hypothetical protein
VGDGKEAPMGSHYIEARKVVAQGDVAVVILHDDMLATLAFTPKPADRKFLFHADTRFRVAALLIFMDEAHRQLEERL